MKTLPAALTSFCCSPQDDNYGRSVQTVNNENRIRHVRKELDDLKKQVSVSIYVCCPCPGQRQYLCLLSVYLPALVSLSVVRVLASVSICVCCPCTSQR